MKVYAIRLGVNSPLCSWDFIHKPAVPLAVPYSFPTFRVVRRKDQASRQMHEENNKSVQM